MDIENKIDLKNISLDGVNRRQYGVSFKYFKGEETAFYKRIDYDAEIVIDAIGIIEVSKKNIYYNQQQPDLLSEIVSSVLSKSIYPVKTSIDSKGLSTMEVLNPEKILDRFNFNKKVLLENYKSQELDLLLDSFEKRLRQSNYLESIFRQDWFCNLLFHPKLLGYKGDESIDTHLVLSVVPYDKPMVFKGKQRITEVSTTYDSHVICFESEEQGAPKHFIPEKSPSGTTHLITLKVFFDIDIYRNFSMHTRANLTIVSEDATGNRKVIKRVEYTQYQKNPTVNYLRTGKEVGAFLVEDENGLTVEKKKRGFWNIFQ